MTATDFADLIHPPRLSASCAQSEFLCTQTRDVSAVVRLYDTQSLLSPAVPGYDNNYCDCHPT